MLKVRIIGFNFEKSYLHFCDIFIAPFEIYKLQNSL